MRNSLRNVRTKGGRRVKRIQKPGGGFTRRCGSIATLLILPWLWFTCSIGLAAPIEKSEIHIIDGDTIRAHGHPYRLVGFDAPETGSRARCGAEIELGHRATGRLRELVDAAKLDLTEITCSCPRGTHGTRFCNYGRRCGTLTADDRDVGAILIAEKLAHPLLCAATRCPPARSWCESQRVLPSTLAPQPLIQQISGTPKSHVQSGRGGCGSRGGPGYRLPNGKCASHRH